MSRFTATPLDLSRLPAPTIVAVPDYEALLAARKADLAARVPEVADVLALESEPLTKDQETNAWFELQEKQRFNDGARAVMLAFSWDTHLEQLGAFYGLTRRVIEPATATSLALVESDEELRARLQLAPEAFNTCGSAGSYVHHALDAAPELSQAAALVSESASGNKLVRVVCCARSGNGEPSEDTLATVRARLWREDVKPLTVPVSVIGARARAYAISLTLSVPAGPDPSLVQTAALTAVMALTLTRRKLGVAVLTDAIKAAARVSGVEIVLLASPAEDIAIAPDEVSHCTGITISVTTIALTVLP